MTRDMDLIRLLLLRIEERKVGIPGSGEEALSLSATRPPLCLPGEEPEAIHYNMRLLADAGYLDMTTTQFAGSFNVRGLTWAGHDFLDSVREPEVWRKTRDGALSAGGFTFDLLKDLAKAFAKKQIEDRTGLKL